MVVAFYIEKEWITEIKSEREKEREREIDR